MKVEFNKDRGVQYKQDQGITGFLISSRIVKNKSQAAVFMLILSVFSIAAAGFILKGSDEEDPQIDSVERRAMLAEEGIYEY